MAQSNLEAAAGPWVPEVTFGQRLLLLRNSLRMTQEEIARKCGIHQATWNTWEHGTSPRNQGAAVEKIAEATGVDKGWLLWGALLLAAPIIFDTPPEQLELDLESSVQLFEVSSLNGYRDIPQRYSPSDAARLLAERRLA